MSDHTKAPTQLVRAFQRWDGSDRQPQSEFAWKPASWHRRFKNISVGHGVDLRKAVETVQENAPGESGSQRSTVNREIVTTLFKPETLRSGSENQRRQAVVTAFVASMVWGYGQVGYGPYRTERVLTSSPNAIDSLVEVAQIAQDPKRGGLEAFKHIQKERQRPGDYLKYLGPAFGTKYLYFLTKASSDVGTTPVMDALVAKWFRRYATSIAGFNLSWWDSASYERYLLALETWAREIRDAHPRSAPLDLDDVEFLIFSTTRDGSADAWGSLIDTDEVSVEVMLDHLASEASGREGVDTAEGLERVERLREWFAESTDRA